MEDERFRLTPGRKCLLTGDWTAQTSEKTWIEAQIQDADPRTEPAPPACVHLYVLFTLSHGEDQCQLTDGVLRCRPQVEVADDMSEQPDPDDAGKNFQSYKLRSSCRVLMQ